MLHLLDGFVEVPTENEPPLSVYFNLQGGRVTTKNATGFDPAALEVRRRLGLGLGFDIRRLGLGSHVMVGNVGGESGHCNQGGLGLGDGCGLGLGLGLGGWVQSSKAGGSAPRMPLASTPRP